MSQTLIKNVVFVIAGVVLGALLSYALLQQNMTSESDGEQESAPAQPLYWVAPMDPNFRRDKPGKSPMGMDLVPVYAEQGNAGEPSPGTVKIASNVENNLGVRTAVVKEGTLQVPIRTVGYIQYNQDELVHIHPRVEGWIETLHVKASGEKVDKDQPLYALYSPQLVNAQEEYLLALNRDNKGLTVAALARLKALQMPDDAIEALQQSRKVMQTVSFRAPQSGVIDNLNIREGFFVKPGTTLMSIGSLDEVWVEAEVFERQAASVKVGLPVTMTLDYLPGTQWQGEVDYIYPTLDEKTRTLRARLRFANPDRQLKPNMFAQIEIHADLADQTIMLPREAVIRTGSQDRVVLALGDGRYKSVEVTLGVIAGQQAQILSGLEAGDQVVTSAQFLLDSESSIDSDFQRMLPDSERDMEMDMEMQMEDGEEEIQSAMVDGVINSVNQQDRLLNISRGPIEKWGRGPATLDFKVDESVAMEQFNPGDNIHFTFEIRAGDFVLVELHHNMSMAQ